MAKLRLVRTSESCPEQYDAYQGDVKVGVLHLRHGDFKVYCGTTTVHTACARGDGRFADHERPYHLRLACDRILEHLAGAGNNGLYEIVVPDPIPSSQQESVLYEG